MYYIIYLSAGVNWFTQAELEALLAISNTQNRLNNITGLLLYADGNFIQLLEGDEATVKAVYKKISSDQRHKGVTHIASGNLAARNFPDWAMGFKSISKISETPLKNLLNPSGASQKGHLAVTLLTAFIKTAGMDAI